MVELKVVKTGKKVKLSPHQISFHLKHADMGCPSFILVQYHPPAKLKAKPKLLLYTAAQAADLFARGIETVPLQQWALDDVNWHELRNRLDG